MVTVCGFTGYLRSSLTLKINTNQINAIPEFVFLAMTIQTFLKSEFGKFGIKNRDQTLCN